MRPQFGHSSGEYTGTIRETILGSWRDYLLVLLLVAFSGNPALAIPFGWEPLLVALALLLAGLLIHAQRPLIEPKGAGPFAVFIGLLLVQAVVFRFFPFITVAGFVVRLFIGYAVIRLVVDFPVVYVRVMVCLAQVGIIFWGLGKFGIVKSLLSAVPPWMLNPWNGERAFALLLHTFYTDAALNVQRNAGMFWEPGAFAGYLLLALLFCGLWESTPERREYRVSLAWLTAALLTTSSTAGYVLLPFVLLFSFRHTGSTVTAQLRRGMLLYFAGFFILCSAVAGYSQIEFVGQKIDEQIRKTLYVPEYNRGMMNTRFGSLLFDWEYIKQSPLIGWGIHPDTRYQMHSEDERATGHGNGLTDFTAKFGLIGLVAFGYFVWHGLSKFSGRPQRSLAGVLLILVMLFSETFLNYPLFLGLMFLGSASFSMCFREKHA